MSMQLFNSRRFFNMMHVLFFLFSVSSILAQNQCENSDVKIKKIGGLFSENSFSQLQRTIEKEEKVYQFISSDEVIDKDELCHKLVIESVYYLSLTELYQGVYFQIPQRVERFLRFIEESSQFAPKEKRKYQEKLFTLLGEYYLELKEFSKAKENYLKSYHLVLQELDSMSSIRRAICYVNLGHGIALATTRSDSLEIANNKIDTAIAILTKNVASIDTINFNRINAYASLYKARVYIKGHQIENKKHNKKLLSAALKQIKNLEHGFVNERISLMVPHYQAEIYLALGENALAKKKLNDLIDIWDIKIDSDNPELLKYYANYINELFRIALKLDNKSTANKLYQSYIKVEEEKLNFFLKEYEISQINLANLASVLREKEENLKRKEQILNEKNSEYTSLERKTQGLQDKGLLGVLVLLLSIIGFGYIIIKLRKKKTQLELEKDKTQKQKEQLEREVGTIQKNKEEADKQKEFLQVLHENSGVLAKFIEDEELNSDFNLFIQEAINRTFELAKTPLEFDTFGIGVYNEKDHLIEMYAKEVRKGKEEIKPDRSYIFSLKKDKESLPVLVFTNEETPFIMENNYAKEGYKKYFKILPSNKVGQHSGSLIYVKIRNLGVITIQSVQTNMYRQEQVDLLKTIGENIFNAINSIGSSIRIKEINKDLEDKKEHLTILQRDTSHRIKNHLAALLSSINFQLKHSNVKDNVLIQKELLKVKGRTQAVSLVHKMVHQNYGVKDKKNQKYISSQEYFTDLANHFFIKGLGYSKSQVLLNIDLKEEPDMNIEILKDLGKVIVELGLNIYEHAYPMGKKHWVQLQVDNLVKGKYNYLRLIVADKGIGIVQNSKELSNGSIGLKLLERLIKRLRGEIEVKYYYEEKRIGTKYIITMPKNKIK